MWLPNRVYLRRQLNPSLLGIVPSVIMGAGQSFPLRNLGRIGPLDCACYSLFFLLCNYSPASATISCAGDEISAGCRAFGISHEQTGGNPSRSLPLYWQ